MYAHHAEQTRRTTRTANRNLESRRKGKVELVESVDITDITQKSAGNGGVDTEIQLRRRLFPAEWDKPQRNGIAGQKNEAMPFANQRLGSSPTNRQSFAASNGESQRCLRRRGGGVEGTENLPRDAISISEDISRVPSRLRAPRSRTRAIFLLKHARVACKQLVLLESIPPTSPLSQRLCQNLSEKEFILREEEENWTTEAVRDSPQTSIQLKEMTTNATRRFALEYPVWKLFDILMAKHNASVECHLYTNASVYALGAIFAQCYQQGKEKTVAMARRTLSKIEKNYKVTEKEMLGIMWSLQRFARRVSDTTHRPPSTFEFATSTITWRSPLHTVYCKTHDGIVFYTSRNRIHFEQEWKPIISETLQLKLVLDKSGRLMRHSEDIRTCDLCQRCKHVQEHLIGELQPIIPENPLDLVPVELFGPLPQSKAKVSYVFVMMDIFSKYTKLSYKKCLLSDKGTQFTGKRRQAGTRKLNVLFTSSPVRYPRGNPVERRMKSVGNMLMILCHKSHQNWIDKLPTIEYVMNNTVHESTTITSLEALTGRRSEIFDMSGLPSPPQSTHKETEDKTEEAKQELLEFARKKLIPATDRCRKYVNRSKKLMPLYVGPVKIINNCYEVVCLDTGKVLGRYNIMALREYQSLITQEGRPSKGGLRTKDDAVSGVRRANSARGVLLAADSGEVQVLLFRPSEDEFTTPATSAELWLFPAIDTAKSYFPQATNARLPQRRAPGGVIPEYLNVGIVPHGDAHLASPSSALNTSQPFTSFRRIFVSTTIVIKSHRDMEIEDFPSPAPVNPPFSSDTPTFGHIPHYTSLRTSPSGKTASRVEFTHEPRHTHVTCAETKTARRHPPRRQTSCVGSGAHRGACVTLRAATARRGRHARATPPLPGEKRPNYVRADYRNKESVARKRCSSLPTHHPLSALRVKEYESAIGNGADGFCQFCFATSAKGCVDVTVVSLGLGIGLGHVKRCTDIPSENSHPLECTFYRSIRPVFGNSL
ncbi:hypothetical protein PR048_016701 [Dryococelus australis]|uniref:Reverse transcriptase/retrotransposon-derived protein RNase H-like domain-containing protein n=1 Tax=Dryococelus australis TaxID=614101 RepID=A0ABQ9H7G9_9NEOP|nr:hypothetical protein PR048_016701 [Dryococelus australis]